MTNYVDRVRDGVTPVVTASNADPSGLYFFLSLDLVNSTAYKAKNANWPFLTRMFYDDAKSFFANHQYSLKPRAWKYQGDEVLFYRRVQSIEDLAQAVTASYAALRHVSDTVESRTKDASPRLYVKGTCWVANAKYHAPAPVDSMVADPDNRNIVFQSPLAQGALLEFLGPEIDGGFRGSAASLKKALVVSAELASLLHEQADRQVREGLRVVEFRELKGVWGGRHYPIVWYRKDWSKMALDADYEYDDSFRHEILRRAYDADPKQLDELKGIIETVGHDWLPKLNLPKQTPATQPQETAEATVDTSIEVHAVAVCFSPDGKVLLARRHKEKRVHPDAWEAGCAKLQPGDDFASALRRDYKADFGIDLKLVEPLVPIGTYTFEKDGKTIPGVIFVAEVEDVSKAAPHKHAGMKWVDPDALPADVTSRCVPGLRERITGALELRRRQPASSRTVAPAPKKASPSPRSASQAAPKAKKR